MAMVVAGLVGMTMVVAGLVEWVWGEGADGR
jgi:hypothetical protein